MVMEDQYTLIERSDTLIVQSYRTLFTVCSQHQGFNFITFYYFEACISNASVSSENNFGHFGMIGYNYIQEAISNFKLQQQTDQLL